MVNYYAVVFMCVLGFPAVAENKTEGVDFSLAT